MMSEHRHYKDSYETERGIRTRTPHGYTPPPINKGNCIMDINATTTVYIAFACPHCMGRISFYTDEQGTYFNITGEWEPVCPVCAQPVDMPIEYIVDTVVEVD